MNKTQRMLEQAAAQRPKGAELRTESQPTAQDVECIEQPPVLTVHFTYDTQTGVFRAEGEGLKNCMFIAPIDAPLPAKLHTLLHRMAAETIQQRQGVSREVAIDLRELDQKLADYERRHPGRVASFKPGHSAFKKNVERKPKITLEDLGL